MKTQNVNRSSNRFFVINGEKKCLMEWCKIYNKTFPLVRERLAAGLDILEALTRPKRGLSNTSSNR